MHKRINNFIRQAEEKIKALVEKYEKIKSSGKLKSYTEEETKKDLILPLLEALGWNIFDKNEVSAEENIISSGRVDYGIYLNGEIWGAINIVVEEFFIGMIFRVKNKFK